MKDGETSYRFRPWNAGRSLYIVLLFTNRSKAACLLFRITIGLPNKSKYITSPVSMTQRS